VTVVKLPGLQASLLPLLASVCATGEASSLDQHADKLASLIDPAKLATLRESGANPRIQKAVAILADAESEKLAPGAVCAAAIKTVKMKPAAGELTKAALLRNLDIARKLGCLDAAGLDEMRHGKAATIRKGPYRGDQLSDMRQGFTQRVKSSTRWRAAFTPLRRRFCGVTVKRRERRAPKSLRIQGPTEFAFDSFLAPL